MSTLEQEQTSSCFQHLDKLEFEVGSVTFPYNGFMRPHVKGKINISQ